jgi:hypothetical protein
MSACEYEFTVSRLSGTPLPIVHSAECRRQRREFLGIGRKANSDYQERAR